MLAFCAGRGGGIDHWEVLARLENEQRSTTKHAEIYSRFSKETPLIFVVQAGGRRTCSVDVVKLYPTEKLASLNA